MLILGLLILRLILRLLRRLLIRLWLLVGLLVRLRIALGRRLLLPNSFNYSSPGQGEMTLLVWDLEESKIVQTCRGHSGWLNDVSVSRDGSRYATASDDRVTFYCGSASRAVTPSPFRLFIDDASIQAAPLP